jgi:hypothetical protein
VASAEQVCGSLCCPSGTTCFANACVTPGKTCRSAGDCAPDEYCEPSLADSKGKSSTPSKAPGCFAPAPSPGRCLKLPERCGTDGSGGPNCLPACEVHPEQGKLDAVEEWSWNATNVKEYKDFVDVWNTPVIGRVTDTNCDGSVDELDPPNIIFVAGDSDGTCCQCTKRKTSACHDGVLRVLDGASGKEIWSLRSIGGGSKGFMGTSVALGDLMGDAGMEIVAITAEGHIVILSRDGKLLAKSDTTVPGYTSNSFGWGGGLAIGDMNGDGAAEVTYGASIWTTASGGLKHVATGKHGVGGGGNHVALSLLADVDGDGKLELVAGNAVYRFDGSALWYNKDLGDGYPAVGDFDKDGKPELVTIRGGKVTLVNAADGKIVAGPFALPGTGSGGAPTVADFDGDGLPEVGVAKANQYVVADVDMTKAKGKRLSVLWAQVNHDMSSSVTGSTVFDFQGDGRAEVIYNDECFIWVYDGKTGDVLFAAPTTSFTGTEASLVADVDGDGKAEMVMIANRANPDSWKCTKAPWNAPDPKLNRPAWTPPKGEIAHSGITIWGDRFNRWVGTRTLWNQHTYHVTNICDERDSACEGQENRYGAIPRQEKKNWAQPWLNNFRQNVLEKGLFDAPDAEVSLRVDCASPMTLRATVRNIGFALLPKGITVGFYVEEGSKARKLAELTTSSALFPGQAIELPYAVTPADGVHEKNVFVAQIEPDPNARYKECREANNISLPAKQRCAIK